VAEWLIYALGGGWGHLTRAMALARAAPADCRARILTNSPYAELAGVECGEKVDLAGVDCLIVDTFPRGLVGELVDVLPSFSGVKVLVARDLNPRYADGFKLREFVESHYDLVLSPGDGAEYVSGAHVTAPWLIRSADELLPRGRAFELLDVDGSRPCVAVCASGNRNELAWYEKVACNLLQAGAQVRVIASYWPAFELYNAVDVVVGGGGYNTVYECVACGIPLIARPWPRKYDRQGLRAKRAGAAIVEEAAEAATMAICAARNVSPHNPEFRNGAPDPPSQRPGFQNGAADAAALIARTVCGDHSVRCVAFGTSDH